MSDTTGNGNGLGVKAALRDATATVKETTRSLGAQARDGARSVRDQIRRGTSDAKQATYRKADTFLGRTSNELSSVTQTLHDSASRLEGQDQTVSARLLRSSANFANTVAEGLRGQSAQDLVHKTEDYARRNPLVFILACAALGAVAARFVKSAAPLGEELPLTEELTSVVGSTQVH